MMSTNTPLATNIGAGQRATCVPSRRNWRCMRLCCGGFRRLGRLGSGARAGVNVSAARPTARTPIEQRIPVVANIPIRARLSHPTAPSDVTTMNVAPAIAGATPRYASASAAAGAICCLRRSW